MKLESIINFIQSLYPTKDFIPLHEPYFDEQEKKYVLNTLQTSYVSSVGEYVCRFEDMVADYTGAKYAIALVNGTQALFLALKLIGVGFNDEVITQSLSFVATSNAISYTGAKPVYIDVDEDTIGMSPNSLRNFLKEHTITKNGSCFNKKSEQYIKAVVPVHVCGHPCRVDKILSICNEFGLSLVEDAAESLGSFYKDKHTGTFGVMGILSFNGNKIITTGGGGMLLTNDEELASRARHLSTTAKIEHPYEYIHNDIGYNYRLPNLNAALGAAQMKKLPVFIKAKRDLAQKYNEFFDSTLWSFFKEPENSHSNYWLNTVVFRDQSEKDHFLSLAQKLKVMARSLWRPMHLLDMYAGHQRDRLESTSYLYQCAVNIPSTPLL